MDQKFKFPLIPFRPYQVEAAKKLYIEKILRLLLSRPRRSGKEVETWNLLVQGAVESPGLYTHGIYPTNVRARAVLWDGAILMPNRQSVKFLEMIPKKFIQNINNQDMKIKLINGSVIWVLGSDIDPDKLRGTNARGIGLSEFCISRPKSFLYPIACLKAKWGMVNRSIHIRWDESFLSTHRKQ